MPENTRLDHRIICDLIDRKSKVIDLGCGNGDLLQLLVEEKKVLAQGIELNEKQIYKCVEKGVSVFHGDIESGLVGYPDKSFDYAILNQSMQETKNVGFVIKEALRVGKKVIVGFPNFVHLKARLSVFLRGKVPVTQSLPYRWYDTPNLHFLSITDFDDFCKENSIKILAKHFIGKNKRIIFLANIFALNGIYLISRDNDSK